MKKILFMAVMATFLWVGCTRNSVRNADSGGFSSDDTAAKKTDSINKAVQDNKALNDGYKADSITQTDPIPR